MWGIRFKGLVLGALALAATACGTPPEAVATDIGPTPTATAAVLDPTATPTIAPTSTPTPAPVSEPTATPSQAGEPTPTPTAVAIPTPTATPEPTATQTPSPTATPVGVRNPDGTPSQFVVMDDPKVVTAGQATFLTDDMLVMGYEGETEARAYPVAMMWFHHIVNDIVDGSPVLVTY